MRENVITNNIANIDTPGYKRQDVDFESVLQKALGKTKYSSLDKKVRELNQDLGKLTTTSYTDAANYSYRLDRNNVDENTENAVCIMTRGHVGDYDVQRQMLAIKPYYLGVIGSRRKLAFVKEKLLADGFSAAEIDACHAPIGLAISAVTPAEIAISIAAELIAVRAKREGREKSRYRKP